VVEHVCERHEPISLDTFDNDAKNSTACQHSYLLVVVQRELGKVWNLLANQVVIYLDIGQLLGDLLLEIASLEEGLLLLGKENWEIGEPLWQNVKILVET